ncbi:MAG: GntR family transcriptional regulator [Actinomycetota bacterium]
MAPRSIAESVYRRMRSDLLRGRILPGTRVTEQWAATRYRASRTPVREACRRLAEEGLLTHRPRHGYASPVIDQGEIAELYDVRRALEVASVRAAAAAPGDRPLLAQLRRAWEGEPPAPGEDAVYRDEAFHVGLARIGGNRSMTAFLEQINARIRLVRVHDFLDPQRVRWTITQHLDLLDAVEARDADRAAALVDAHIAESQRHAVDSAGAALAALWTGAAAG